MSGLIRRVLPFNRAPEKRAQAEPVKLAYPNRGPVENDLVELLISMLWHSWRFQTGRLASIRFTKFTKPSMAVLAQPSSRWVTRLIPLVKSEPAEERRLFKPIKEPERLQETARAKLLAAIDCPQLGTWIQGCVCCRVYEFFSSRLCQVPCLRERKL